MTTEDDFHAMLDANPEDHQTRLVLADWLDERGDPRGPGYRALGMLRKHPAGGIVFTFFQYSSRLRNVISPDSYVLPKDWLFAEGLGPSGQPFGIRRATEDWAARVFTMLPAERQAALLAAGA